MAQLFPYLQAVCCPSILETAYLLEMRPKGFISARRRYAEMQDERRSQDENRIERQNSTASPPSSPGGGFIIPASLTSVGESRKRKLPLHDTFSQPEAIKRPFRPLGEISSNTDSAHREVAPALTTCSILNPRKIIPDGALNDNPGPNPLSSQGRNHSEGDPISNSADSCTITEPDTNLTNETNEYDLDPYQTQVLNRVLAGESLFVTGPAGSGKSVVLKAISRAFRKERQAAYASPGYTNRWEVGVTATTGEAATDLGGDTLHHWAGIRNDNDDHQTIFREMDSRAESRWRTSHALVIDEISTLDGRLFKKLDKIAQLARNSEAPFGGIQLICFGDFFQLPPVFKGGEAKFAFQTAAWGSIFPKEKIVCLRQVYRQQDPVFLSLLGRVRKGLVTDDDVHLINTRCQPARADHEGAASHLFPKRREVARFNLDERLETLPGPSEYYPSLDIWRKDRSFSSSRELSAEEASQILDDHSKLPRSLELKVGARVKFLLNIRSSGLYNGSEGVVVDLVTQAVAVARGIPLLSDDSKCYNELPYPVVQFRQSPDSTVQVSDKLWIPPMQVEIKGSGSICQRVQVPLMLAWAQTIHKCQGQTLENTTVDFCGLFAEGQAYVALSRSKTLEGLRVMNFARECVKVSEKVLAWSTLMGMGDED